MKSMIPVESAAELVTEHDAVMLEWQSADWWIESSRTSDQNDLHSTAALAASAGVFVRQGQRSEIAGKESRQRGRSGTCMPVHPSGTGAGGLLFFWFNPTPRG